MTTDFRPGRFNLSAWALRHSQMTLYLLAVFMLAGAMAYFKLGRAENPDFTIKVVALRAMWPGASASEMALQVTEPIEKKLQETPWADVVYSYSRAEETWIFLELKEYTPKAAVPDSWYQVRKKMGDLAAGLPSGVRGPFINDEFGDTMAAIYALTGDGFNPARLREEADRLAKRLYHVPGVKKVELIGVQGEKVYIDLPQSRLASLGISAQMIVDALARQNIMASFGYFEAGADRVYLSLPERFDSVLAVESVTLPIAGKSIRLGDVAHVHRGFSDPPDPRMYYNGKEAIGVGVTMAQGSDVIRLGEELGNELAVFQSSLPIGLDIHQVADQPEVVRSSLGLFMRSLAEAVFVVLLVSFLSLGVRAGAVVALAIPLVLSITFLFMSVFGISLQRVSLGALVIALGLLVDDAIIAVEMMVVKMEEGWDRFRAASFAYASTAFPMLTGTLVTAAGFMPVGFARSMAGEFAFSIFAVVTIALLVSWIVAVVFTPWIGTHLLNPERIFQGVLRGGKENPYDSRFYQRFRKFVGGCVARPWQVVGITLLAFLLAVGLFATAVQKQFFPPSERAELLIDLWLPEGSTLAATSREARRVEALLRQEMGGDVNFFLSYVGTGSPRFYLALEQQLPKAHFAQFVITTANLAARERLKQKLETLFDGDEGRWAHLRARVTRLENGPPVGYPVQFRVQGEDLNILRGIAEKVADRMRQHPDLRNINYDDEWVKTVRLKVDYDRARALGVSAQELSGFLGFLLQGQTATRLREGDQQVDMVLRVAPDGAGKGSGGKIGLNDLENLSLHLSDGRDIPLAQVLRTTPDLEAAVISRRHRLSELSVRADIRDDGKGNGKYIRQPVSITEDLLPEMERLKAQLPPGYTIEISGAAEKSGKAGDSLKAVVPAMLAVIITLLMVQLQHMGRVFLILLTAPLGLIGVALSLTLFRAPYGFVANLGVIALCGMIMRNSVILVDQIERNEKAGQPARQAIIEAAVRRFRPIMLTAACTMLAMFPLSRQIFWGPMAVAIMGGLLVATLLTLIFLPALYAIWRKVPALPDSGAAL